MQIFLRNLFPLKVKDTSKNKGNWKQVYLKWKKSLPIFCFKAGPKIIILAKEKQ